MLSATEGDGGGRDGRGPWDGWRPTVLAWVLLVSVLLHGGAFVVARGWVVVAPMAERLRNLASQELLIEAGIETAPEMKSSLPDPASGGAGPRMAELPPAAPLDVNVIASSATARTASPLLSGSDFRLPGGGVKGLGFGAGPGGLGTGRGFSIGGRRVEANVIFVVLDASGSMKADAKLDRARAGIRRLAQRGGVRIAGEAEVEGCAFRAVSPGGGGGYGEAGAVFLEALAREKTIDAIYFFSDFQDPVDAASTEAIREAATRRFPKVRIYLHALEANVREALSDLVRATGGDILYEDPPR